MQWTLFLPVLMGQCCFSTRPLYQYHFIRENKTWDEAQTYCRKTYTDLATVSDMTDMMRLCSSAQNQDEAWIGLYNYSQPTGAATRTWYWSGPGLEFNTSNMRWARGEPNGEHENCALLDSKQWSDYPCTDKFPFICYKETKPSNITYHNITTSMTWPQAQRYCRQNYTDLVSGLDQLGDPSVKDGSKVWIGLFSDTWRWSDGSRSSFRNWQRDDDLVDGQSTKKCATVLNTGGTWSSDYCGEQKPFYCYEDKLILIKENKTWVEALSHCRDNYYDLVSITNTEEQSWVEEKVKNASSGFVWLGLRYTCTLGFWFWVSDEVLSYTNWASGGTSDGCDRSVAINTADNMWYKINDNERFYFICTKG